MPFLGKVPSQLVDSDVDIDGGSIDGVSIGSVTANAGAFTNLTATGTLTLPDDAISGDDIDGGTISNVAISGTTASFSGDLTVDTNTLYVDSTNNRVGIGTTNPAANNGKLVIGGVDTTNGNPQGSIAFADGGNNGQARILSSRGTSFQKGSLDFQVAQGTVNSYVTALTIAETGNVGIGTDAPATPLNIKAAVPDVTIQATTESFAAIDAGLVLTGSSSGAPRLNTQWRMANKGSDLSFAYAGSATPSMLIASTGNVGIGTDSPDSLLDLSATSPAVTLNDSGDGSYAQIIYGGSNLVLSSDQGNTGGASTMIFKVDSSEAMRITSDGNVLVARTATTNSATDYGFNIYNTGQIYVYSTSAGTDDVWRAYSQGTVTSAIDGNGTYQNLSDSKYKDNIAPTSVGLSEIQALNVVSFDWNTSGDHVIAGYVAQELMTVLPNLVSADDETGDLRVNHMGIIPVLTKAIQDQQAIIEDLQTRLSALEAN